MSPTKQELKERLRRKLEAKKQLRDGKKAIKKERELKVNNNEDIRASALCLMMDVDRLMKRGATNMVQLDRVLGKKYDFLKKKYFGVYRAVLAQELPLPVLDMMLSQKSRIDNNEVTAERASLEVGTAIAEKLNVDVNALTKAAQEIKAKQEAEEKQ